jgi:hypothetical protein
MADELTCPMCHASFAVRPSDYDQGRAKCKNCGEWIPLTPSRTGEMSAVSAAQIAAAPADEAQTASRPAPPPPPPPWRWPPTSNPTWS